MSDFDEIRNLAQIYFDSLYDADAEGMAKIFHPKGRMFFVTGEETKIIERDEYIEILKNRVAPRAQNAKRNDELLGISINSPNAAIITLRVLLAGKHYSDQLCLVRENGRWSIMSKFYYLLAEDA
jgi:hypothetical protein